MQGVTIEPAGSEDVDTVTELWLSLAAGQRTYGSHILPEENRAIIRESISRHAVADAILVARSDSVVGFVMFTLDTGSFHQDRRRGIVENIYVRPDYRGRGIGSALLGAAEEALRDRDADVVSLEVMAANDRALEFYRQQGYDPHRVEMERPLENDTLSKGDQ